MELRLRNIYCYNENNSNVYMSIEAHYGWNGEMHGDIIKLNYNGIKDQTFLTVKAKNPGIGSIIERIIEVLKDIDPKKDSNTNTPKIIIDILSNKIGMKYDNKKTEEALSQHQDFILKNKSDNHL